WWCKGGRREERHASYATSSSRKADRSAKGSAGGQVRARLMRPYHGVTKARRHTKAKRVQEDLRAASCFRVSWSRFRVPSSREHRCLRLLRVGRFEAARRLEAAEERTPALVQRGLLERVELDVGHRHEQQRQGSAQR